MLLHEMQPPGAQGATQTIASLRREQTGSPISQPGLGQRTRVKSGRKSIVLKIFEKWGLPDNSAEKAFTDKSEDLSLILETHMVSG